MRYQNLKPNLHTSWAPMLHNPSGNHHAPSARGLWSVIGTREFEMLHSFQV